MADFHIDKSVPTDPNRPWYADMTRYHWFVFLVAALGWLFDCLDQQLFTLARIPALKDLLGLPQGSPEVKSWAGHVTSIFLVGWATGGLFFGVLGDRIGRAKTMMLTILLYSLCTGLSSFSVGVWDFAFYRFLTGLGVGGEFAVGVALVAEVMPTSARARSLSLLQALSALGNMSAALISMGLGELEETGVLGSYTLFGFEMTAWRIMFLIGAVPALLALVIRRRLKEPERWQATGQSATMAQKRGSYSELFNHPIWRRHAIIGLMLAIPGVVGLWGIGFFSTDLTRSVFRKQFATEEYQQRIALAEKVESQTTVNDLKFLLNLEINRPAQGKEPKLTAVQESARAEADKVIGGRLTRYVALTLLMQQVGAFFGMYTFGWLAQKIGRRPTFFFAFLFAMFTTAAVFWFLESTSDIYWLVPIMGYFQLSIFAGYAIYFPELFPTYLRSTGTSFCYNVGRFVAAGGPAIFGVLTSRVFAGPDYPDPMPYRYSGVLMSLIFLVGIVTLIWAPETKDKPLPE